MTLHPQLVSTMYKLLILIAAAVVVEGQVNIFAAQYGTILNITCEFQNNVNVAHVVSLVITKSEDDLIQPQASLNSFNGQTNHIGSASLLGRISNDHRNSTLTLQWNENANSGLDGTYICTMVALDSNDFPFTRSEKFAFKWDDMDPVITATPINIVDVLTPSLTLECSMINKYARNNTEVDTIEIYKNNNGDIQLLAYANSSNAEITTRDNRWAVIGNYFYGQSSTLYLAIKLTSPNTTDAGKYVCDFSAFRYNETDTVNNETSTAENRTSIVANGTGATENGTGSTYNGISTSHTPTGIREHILRSAQVTASGSTRQEVSAIIEAMEPLKEYYLYSCNFEKGNCDLNVTTTSGYVYSTIMEDRVLANGRNLNGHYLHNEFDFSRSWTSSYERLIVATQLIPERTRNTCVRVWFRLVSSYVNTMRINVRNNYSTYGVWSMSGNSQWYTGIEVNTQISSYYTSTPFILSFEFEFYTYYYNSGKVSIDDILITDINCG